MCPDSLHQDSIEFASALLDCWLFNWTDPDDGHKATHNFIIVYNQPDKSP